MREQLWGPHFPARPSWGVRGWAPTGSTVTHKTKATHLRYRVQRETVGYRGTEEGATDSIWEGGHLSWTGWVVLLKDRGEQPRGLVQGS